MKEHVAAVFSPSDPEKEAEIVAEYLWHFESDFNKSLSVLIKDAEWPDLLKIRDTWGALWIKVLRKAAELDNNLSWCLDAAKYHEAVLLNKEKLMHEFRKHYEARSK